MLTYSRSQRAVIVIFAFLCTVFDGADFTVFLFYMAPLAKHLEVSLVEVSTIQAASYIVGIVGGILFGRFSDQRGRRLGLFATVIVFSVFTVVTAFVDSYETLFVVRVLAGLGIGGESGIAFAYLNEAFPGRDQRRGLASGLLQSMFLVGAWTAAWLYRVTSHFGDDSWRIAFGVLGGAGLVVGIGTLFMPESKVWLQRRQELQQAASESPQAKGPGLYELLRGPLGRRALIASGLLTASFYGSYAVFMYGPAMWQNVYHMDSNTVGNIGMVAAILGALSYIGGGALSDRIGRRRAYTVTAFIGVVAYLLFAVSLYFTHSGALGTDTVWLMLPVYFLLTIGYGYFGVQGVWLSELFPTEVRTTAQNAVYYTGRAIGAGAAPVIGLLIAQSFGLDVSAAVAFGGIGALGAIVLCRMLPETGKKEL